VPHLSAFEVMIHYEEALNQVYVPVLSEHIHYNLFSRLLYHRIGIAEPSRSK